MTVVDVNTGKFTGSGRQPRGDRHQEQPRGGRGDRPPAPAARHRRHHRRRLHRHGAREQPRPRAAPARRVPGPRPHPAPGRRGDLARPGADDPQADRHRPPRGVQRDLRALPGPRADRPPRAGRAEAQGRRGRAAARRSSLARRSRPRATTEATTARRRRPVGNGPLRRPRDDAEATSTQTPRRPTPAEFAAMARAEKAERDADAAGPVGRQTASSPTPSTSEPRARPEGRRRVARGRLGSAPGVARRGELGERSAGQPAPGRTGDAPDAAATLPQTRADTEPRVPPRAPVRTEPAAEPAAPARARARARARSLTRPLAGGPAHRDLGPARRSATRGRSAGGTSAAQRPATTASTSRDGPRGDAPGAGHAVSGRRNARATAAGGQRLPPT